MTIQYSTTLRIGQLDQVESVSGTAPVIRFYNGAPPALCSDAATGTMLCSFALPSDWMAAAGAAGNVVSKAMAGTWSGTGDAGAGGGTNAGYFRIWNSAIATTHVQGTVTATGGGGDMTLNNISIASGQAVQVTTFTITSGNA